MSQAVAFVSGIVFALGLGIAGMTQPGKVTAFLDLTGAWDPSLLFVMVGAITVYALGYRWVVKNPKPLFTDAFRIPALGTVDRRLVMGSALFGVGWGLAGFCPGPALVSIVTLQSASVVFVGAMLVGMGLFEGLERMRSRS